MFRLQSSCFIFIKIKIIDIVIFLRVNYNTFYKNRDIDNSIYNDFVINENSTTSTILENYSFNNLNEDYYFKDFTNELYLSLLSINIKKIHLCGYSMGARLALAFTSKYPNFVKTLILESGTVGISDTQEKDEIRSKDLNKSMRIKENLNEFIKDWEGNALFDQQLSRNKEGFINQRQIRLAHDKIQLSKSIEVFSKGNMPYLLNSYVKLSLPIIIINGKDDRKYIKEGRVMLNANDNSKQYIIDEAGHNVHLDNTDLYLRTLTPYLKEEEVLT